MSVFDNLPGRKRPGSGGAAVSITDDADGVQRPVPSAPIEQRDEKNWPMAMARGLFERMRPNLSVLEGGIVGGTVPEPPGEPIPWHEPDDEVVLRRLFSLDV